MALRAIILTGSSIGPSRVEAAAAAPGPPRGVIIYLSSASRAVMDASGPAKLAVAASVTRLRQCSRIHGASRRYVRGRGQGADNGIA